MPDEVGIGNIVLCIDLIVRSNQKTIRSRAATVVYACILCKSRRERDLKTKFNITILFNTMCVLVDAEQNTKPRVHFCRDDGELKYK